MGVVVPDEYGLASLKWNVTGITEPMVVTFGIFHPTQPPAEWPVDINTAAIAAELIVGTGMLNGWTYGTCTVIYGTPTGPLTFEDTISNSGEAGEGGMAVNSAVLVRKNTSSGGRANRGRLFSPPFALIESKVSQSGVIATADRDAIQSHWAQFLTNLETAGYQMVILHSNPLMPPTTVISLTVDSVIATQRRRLHR
uniref:Uncharacterized protein n=1 Tax=uncultured prokaryote TaxID=198431 RepID=A0A0H5Q433_9ZZZZ|nr:hypothetical protein [uncultured prokaryote]